MMLKFAPKIIRGVLCRFSPTQQAWIPLSTRDIFRGGMAFVQRGPFPPIKFN